MKKLMLIVIGLFMFGFAQASYQNGDETSPVDHQVKDSFKKISTVYHQGNGFLDHQGDGYYVIKP